MTADEQLQWATAFGEYLRNDWACLENIAKSKTIQWTIELQRTMDKLIGLLLAWPFAVDFCEQARRYNDYSARVYRMPMYVNQAKTMIEQMGNEPLLAAISVIEEKPKRGRPASAETIARREAEEKAKKQQTSFIPVEEPKTKISSTNPETTPFIAPVSPDRSEYKLSIAQIRAFLSPELQERSDQIRSLRSAASAASERAKIMSDMKADPKSIEPYTREAIQAHDTYMSIYGEIDVELAILWYRLQNDSPEWKETFCRRFGYKNTDEIHPDLLHDLKKHYQKVQTPDFDMRCQTLIEQENPAYVKKQKEESVKKKEVQDILRYLKRKDKGASEARLKTSREKFKRLEQLLGKKEAADYKPLLAKIESDYKSSKVKTKK